MVMLALVYHRNIVEKSFGKLEIEIKNATHFFDSKRSRKTK